MLLESEPIEQIAKRVYSETPPVPSSFERPNPLDRDESGIRPNSASIEDTGLGDSGKGRAAQQVNADLVMVSPTGLLYSERFNGTGNAGHEIFVNGIRIALHQLPVASVQEGATAILGKGMLIHAEDLVTEMKYVERNLGTKLPARILIDRNATVTTDLHRAFEVFCNNFLGVGHGNTASGVSPGYASYYEKRAISIGTLMSDNWKEVFTKQYQFYASLMGGEDVLASSMAKALTIDGKKEAHKVGSIHDFLERLEQAREVLLPYVSDVRDEVERVWRFEPKVPFTFESAQGPLLDPYFGLYPDITASRPLGIVGIPDSTEGVVRYSEIAFKLAVLKTPYMSSVGARIPPYEMNVDIANMYRTENGEMGKSTGRARGIFPIDLVAMRAAQRVSQYEYLAITHFDSNHEHIPIEVVTRYINRFSKYPQPFRPYQWHWDEVEGVIMNLQSWDGKKAAQAHTVEELPPQSLQLMSLVEQILGPVALVTNGPKLGETIYTYK